MAIRKPEPGKSYSALRAKHPPKRTERRILNIEERPDEAPEVQDTAKSVGSAIETSADKAVDEPAVQKGQGGTPPVEPGDIPSSDPKPENADGLEVKPVEQATHDVRPDVEIDTPPSLDTKPDRAPEQDRDQPSDASNDAKIGFRGTVLEPSEGVSPFFDKARPSYGGREIIKALFERIETEDLRDDGPVPDYPSTGKKIQVTARVSSVDFEFHRNVIDPLGLIADFTAKSLVLRRILALHFERQRSRSGKA